ncbi:phage/plasmid replication protein [Pectinatus frisingensis]|uniref:phage/plasmid replication domain-containing protein n=1 Tax=Pectinatus frisingensis TaxID=865 RepID=UPI0018C6DD2E|nr:phage/plasmid replication protein [Pectinatus frisingensis]
MTYSPHTLELSLILTTEKFHKLQSKAYEKSQGNHRVYQKNGVCCDEALKDKGVKIEYHNNTYKKKIKFIINPTKVLGGNDVKKLWKPNDDNIRKLLRKLKEYIDGYFDSKYKLNDFKLTRIDFTVNIDVGDRNNVSAYIKVLRNIGKVKGFGPKYDKDDEEINPDLSFDLKGNSNGVEFTAYDKEAESRQKAAKGILRVEVRLKKQKAIGKYTDETAASKQIKYLAANSKDIFLNTFTRIVPRGDYYKKKEAVQLIEDNISQKKHREKMLRLIELVPKKKSLYLAQKEMSDRNIDKVMAMFAKINVSPITISKRHKTKYLKNLYSNLL